MMDFLWAKRVGKATLAGTLGAVVVVALASAPAYAASASAGKNGFDHNRQCDAQVHVSDDTSYGMVEVFGGFACPTGVGLFNEPVPTTITVKIFRNGIEIIQSQKDCATNHRPFTFSTDYHSITYPDYSSTDRFKGVMQITSFSGSVTLTTGEIST